MQNSFLTLKSWLWLFAMILLIAGGMLNLSQRSNAKFPPTDGIYWKKTDQGIIAAKIEPDSTGARAGISKGDKLLAISLDEKIYDEIIAPSDVQIYLDQAGLGNNLTYLIQKTSYSFSDNFYYAELHKLEGAPRWTARIVFLYLVGLIYLFIGVFVLFKQGGRSPFVLHFATLCLTAYVFHCFKPIGLFKDVDLGIAIFNDAALILFAPLFLHFCLIYPVRNEAFKEHKWRVWLLYAPAMLLTGAMLFSYLYNFLPIGALAIETIANAIDSNQLIVILYRLIFAHFIAGLSAGAIFLLRRSIQTKQTVVRQRLKWVIAGTIAAIIPLTVFTLAQEVFDLSKSDWLTGAAILPLSLIPLSFGHSVIRYRLMDVDIVVRRALVYALTTLAISALIGGLAIGLVLFAFGQSPLVNELPQVFIPQIVVASIVMAAIVLLSAPLKNFLQERADRFFYGERYDLRRSLLDFGKTLSATTELDSLLNALVSRLQQVLNVEKVAVFVEDEEAIGEYRIARSAGLSNEFSMPGEFRQMIRTNSAKSGIVRADALELVDLTDSDSGAYIRQELHYFIPCVVRGKMVAVIGLGRTTDGSLLSSEDIEILRTVSGYVGVAIENSLLYQEQQRRADELALLKEFNESIVESVNVGLLAVDNEGIITRCNTTVEDLFGLRREEAVGKRVEELFADEFSSVLASILGKTRWQLTEIRNAYKLFAETRDGVSMTLNIAIAPLRAPSGERTGAILVLEDVSSRIKLEEQLQQREKLSSIGLLAAGVAHEVNTPLTGVSSYTQMLLGMIPETDPKHALLQKVQRQTDRATNIVGNLLNFSRAGSSADFNELEVNRILEDTIQLLEVQLRRSNVELIRNYTPDLPKIYGNAGKLQQVFTNLILNARDAINNRGSFSELETEPTINGIVVKMKDAGGRIELETKTSFEGVVIQVKDNGEGISPENLTKIYDPFFTTKEVGKGTGLGLAVTYGIIEEHGGQVSVESELEKGTTFNLTFPIAETQAKAIAS